MQRVAARLLVTMGMVMMVMSALIRLAKLPPADAVVDDLAILISLITALLGAAYLRFGPRDDSDGDRPAGGVGTTGS